MDETLNDYAKRLVEIGTLIDEWPLVHELSGVIYERGQQDKKWGQQNHEPEVWLAILVEEVGELAQEMLNARFLAPDDRIDRINRMRCEAQQVAAVAVAFMEYLGRTGGAR